MPHQGVTADYNPWNSDQEFLETWGAIRKHTLVDQFRCYTLWSLVENVAKLPDGDFLEVGVWKGGTGALIAKKLSLMGYGHAVFLCDTFEGVVKAGEKDTCYVGGEHSDSSKQTVLNLLDSVHAHAHILTGTFPEETGEQVEAFSFRFCHIDVDVHNSARDTFNWVWPRLVQNGVVVFDDYGFASCAGVTEFVNKIKNDKDKLFMYNASGQAVIVKIC